MLPKIKRDRIGSLVSDDGTSTPYESIDVDSDTDNGYLRFTDSNSTYFYKNVAGETYFSVLDGANNVADSDIGYTWGSYLAIPQDSIDFSAFLGDGDKLHYYGFEASNMMTAITGVGNYGISGNFWKDIYANVSDGAVTSIEADSVALTSTNITGTFSLHYETTVQGIDEIATPAPIEGDADAVAKFNEVLANMKSEKFQATAYDPNYSGLKNVYTYVPDSYLLIESDSMDYSTGEYVPSYTGYVPLGDDSSRISPFKFSLSSGTVSSSGPSTESSLADHLPWDIDPEVLEFTDTSTGSNTGVTGTFTLNSAVGSISAQSYFQGQDYAYALANTFSMNVVDGNIVSIDYDYSFFGITGSDQVGFVYGDDIVIPDGFDPSGLTEWVQPSSWDEAYPDIYSALVSYFGETGTVDPDTQADSVPYLFDSAFNDYWVGQGNVTEGPEDGVEGYNIYNSNYSNDGTDYFLAMKAQLDDASSGFTLTKQTTDEYGYDVYFYQDNASQVEIIINDMGVFYGYYIYDMEALAD